MDGEENERSQRERVLRERSRRSSIASLLHQRANEEEDEPEEFTPTYDDAESNEMDPNNLGENLSEADLYFYSQMIVGDAADNIKVCKGYGKAYALKLFKDSKSEFSLISQTYRLYKQVYGDEARAMFEQAKSLLTLKTDCYDQIIR